MSVRFALWFAAVDLFGRRRSQVLSGVHLLSLAALAALALCLVGLVLGSDRRQRAGYRNDPVATSLVLRPKLSGEEITTDDVSKLRGALAGVRVRAIEPFRLFEKDFFPVGKEGFAPRCSGRSYGRDDPLFSSFSRPESWLSGGPPGPGAEGIILTADMLDRLGIPRDRPPGEIEVMLEVESERLKVLGVLRDALPGRFHFAMPDALVDALQKRAATPPARKVRTGLLPPRWASGPPPGDVAAALARNRVKYSTRAERDVDEWVWVLESVGPNPPRLREWRDILNEVAAQLPESERKEFIVPRAAEAVKTDERAVEGPKRVAAYVESPDDMGRALAAARALDYVPLDDRHEQIERIHRTTAKYLTMSWLVLLGLAVLMLCNSLALHGLQAQQKAPEVGMLKAMGVTRPMLALIGVLEAVLLWLPAMVIGLPFGWVLGIASEWYLAKDDPASGVAFGVSYGVLGVILGGTLLMSLLSPLLAGLRNWWVTPLESLGES